MSRLPLVKAIVLSSAILFSPLSIANTTTPLGNTVEASRQVVSDTAITTKIKAMYVSQKVFGDKDVSVLGVKVETINGIVYLTGTVTTETQANNAIKIAKVISGVKKVIFDLKVKPAA